MANQIPLAPPGMMTLNNHIFPRPCCRLVQILFSAAFVLAISTTLVPTTHADESSLDMLLHQVDQRLLLMREVAAYKYAHDMPIENSEREARVLQSALDGAQEQGLEPKAVDAFFRRQIELAKIVQHGWLAKWQENGGEPVAMDSRPDLDAELRPKLMALGQQIIEKIPAALVELHDSQAFAENLQKAQRQITSPFISSATKHQLLVALIRIRERGSPSDIASQNRLLQILDQGALRVGTTGDYQPFSFIDPRTGTLVGIDIDLAQELAQSLGVRLQLVRTSWPTLMADLAADNFDIGMSGITITAPRQRTAFFSEHYSVGGKTPIARCDSVKRFDSLAKIDRPHIRVIVNPGGTNEKYVRANIKNAQIIVHPDNTTVFDQITKHRAEVMITDAIEVKVQTTANPELCAAMPDKLLTRAEKGFLLHQDTWLQGYVIAWLKEIKRTGKLADIFAAYLGEISDTAYDSAFEIIAEEAG